MKKARIIILISMTLVFTAGALLFLYPAISDYFNKKNSSKIISSYNELVNSVDTSVLDDQLNRAREYNSQLYEHMIILTDPFDPNAFPITDEQYENVLDLNDVMAYIEIPAINVNLPIFHGTSAKTLEKGVGHLENTSLPVGGESTHTVLSAHCGLPSAKLFTDLDRLQIGNIFRIKVMNETLVYQVRDIEIVVPEDFSTLYISRGEDTATLMTCTPYGENTHRLLVHGSRVPNEEAEEIQQNEPKPQKKMTTEDWLNIAMAVLCVIFFVLVILIVIRMCRKDEPDEQS